jgi:hypothetical protein
MSEAAAANVRQAVPFFAVSSMETSLRYYVDGLGFTMTLKWIDEGKLRWCWLEPASLRKHDRRAGGDRVQGLSGAEAAGLAQGASGAGQDDD